MRTKLYVLGAVLGVAPGLLPVVSPLWGSPVPESRQDSRGSSRKGRGAGQASPAPQGNNGNAGVAAPPHAAPAAPGELSHPCELVTIVKVPCDEATAACEYTYWQCPQAVKPLKA
jgi:hypothetical protein